MEFIEEGLYKVVELEAVTEFIQLITLNNS
jgi:hypothetical protein